MSFIEKKTLFNNYRYFTKLRPTINKNPNDKFESKIFLDDNIDRKGYGGLRYKNFFKSSTREKPLISIITPNFKSPDLEKTIISVLKQEYENIELIIIDADSGEETIKILKKYEDHIDLWVSEKDNGLWDGWNKGLKLANGDYIGILDSTSTFNINAIKYLLKYIKNYPDLDFIFGTIISTMLASIIYSFSGLNAVYAVLAGAAYNIGVNGYLTLWAGAYTKTPIDLNSSANALGDKKAFNAKTILVGLPQILLPVLLYFFTSQYYDHFIGCVAVACLGALGIFLKPVAFNLIMKAYKTEKYSTLKAYKSN